VLLAGYDPIEMRRGWCEPFAPGTRVIDVAPRLTRHGVHRVDRSLVGDVGHTLSAIAALTPRASRAAWHESTSTGRAELARIFVPEGDGWGPRAISHALRASWSDEGLVAVDTGAHRIVLSQAFQSRVPHTLLQSTGLCTMACALPLAIGAALASGEPVLAVTGDGGLDMCLGELATARDLGARVTVVLIDDSSLGLIALKQRQEKLPELGVSLGATDYAGLARAMGLGAFVAEDVHALGRAIAASRELGGPSLVHCRIARDAYDDVLSSERDTRRGVEPRGVVLRSPCDAGSARPPSALARRGRESPCGARGAASHARGVGGAARDPRRRRPRDPLPPALDHGPLRHGVQVLHAGWWRGRARLARGAPLVRGDRAPRAGAGHARRASRAPHGW
jgi:hypothetical protein